MDRMKTDVLVIGAGPIGLTAANLLADHGIQVIVVEKNSGTSDLPRAISATDETLRIMEQIGVMDKLGPEMLLNAGARYFGRYGQLLAEVKPGHPRLGQPGKSHFDQPIMEALLLEAAQSRPRVEILFNTEAFTITDQADGVETTIIDEGGKTIIESAWVLACDGGRSPVRAQMGIPLEGTTQPQKWIVVDTQNSDPNPEPFSEFHCNGTRPLVVVPGVKGRRRYEFMLLPGEDAHDVTEPDFVIGLISDYEKVRPEDIRRSAVYVAHQRMAGTYRRGRTLLAGDAAHLMPPFAGQALNAGIRDVANLSWKLAATILQDAPDALIDTYESERKPHARDMVRLSHRIGQIVMSTRPAVTVVRDGMIHATGLIPPLKRWVTGMKFIKQPNFQKGCLVAPDPSVSSEAAAFVGRALPQPELTIDSGLQTPLDKLLDTGWSILRFTEGDTIDILQQVDKKGAFEITAEVQDSTGVFEVIPSGTSLVVRPDRYVAAVASQSDEGAVLRKLAELVPSLKATAPTCRKESV